MKVKILTYTGNGNEIGDNSQVSQTIKLGVTPKVVIVTPARNSGQWNDNYRIWAVILSSVDKISYFDYKETVKNAEISGTNLIVYGGNHAYKTPALNANGDIHTVIVFY